MTLFYAGIVPLKDDKLDEEMLKDVSHADVAKGEDDADAAYDDYYDVSEISTFHIQFHFLKRV